MIVNLLKIKCQGQTSLANARVARFGNPKAFYFGQLQGHTSDDMIVQSVGYP